MDSAYISIRMVLAMKATGLKTCVMDTERNPGQMVHLMMDNIKWDKSLEMENSFGQINLFI